MRIAIRMGTICLSDNLWDNKNCSYLPICESLVTSLDRLPPGENGIIRSITADASLQKRLAALGFRIGKRVELIRRASFNGPLHVRLGTTDVILRAREAQLIEISTSTQAQQ